jgi:hypothetical protein
VERRPTDETNKFLSAIFGKSSARTPFEFRRAGRAHRNPPLTTIEFDRHCERSDEAISPLCGNRRLSEFSEEGAGGFEVGGVEAFVNQAYTGARRATASCGRPCWRRRRARLVALRNSQDFAYPASY